MLYDSIPVNYKKLDPKAVEPTQQHPGDLFDVYALNFKTGPKSILLDKDSDNPSCLVQPGGWCMIKTGIAFELPVLAHNITGYEKWMAIEEVKKCNQEGDNSGGFEKLTIKYVAQLDVRPRSGLAWKEGISIINSPGTIDNGYRDELGVIVQNLGVSDYKFTRGDRIAQIGIRPQYQMKLDEVSILGQSDRGTGGFGSTGK